MRYTQQRLAELGALGKFRKYAADATAKQCTRCGIEKPLEAFSVFKNGQLGRQARCKQCINEIGKEYTRRTREAKAGRARSATCDACGEPNTARRSLHWDHDHNTGAFRGWLCHGCNTALGSAGESAERLRKLIAYLERGGGAA